MKKCASCLKSSRKLQRAVLLTGPAQFRPALVCQTCARTGWLVVFAAVDDPHESHRLRRLTAKALGALTREERAEVLANR